MDSEIVLKYKFWHLGFMNLTPELDKYSNPLYFFDLKRVWTSILWSQIKIISTTSVNRNNIKLLVSVLLPC